MDHQVSDTDGTLKSADVSAPVGNASRSAGRKLALIMAILMVPLLLTGYFLARSGLDQIRSAEREAAGVASVRQLSPLFFSLAWNNDDSLATARDRLAKGKFAASLSDKFNTHFSQLLANARVQTFSRRQLLSETRDLLRRIASETGLLQDDVVARYFLSDALVKQLPDLVVLAKSGATHATMDQFNGEYTALQNATFEDLSTAIQVDRSGTFAKALNAQLSGLDERLEAYKEAIGTTASDDDKPAYENLLMASAEFMTTSTATLEDDIRSGIAAKIRTLTLIALTCGLAAIAAVIFAARMFYSTFHRLDDVALAYEKLETSELEARTMARQLTLMNDDVAMLNKDLAENFRVLKETQDDNIRKSRMAQIGSVTAMVAHELRNPLGAVRNSIFLIGKKAELAILDIARPVERINNAVLRCDGIISQLLEFTSARPLAPVVTIFDDWVVKTVESEARDYASHVVVTCDLGLGTQSLAFDPDAMARALRAVLRNAVQALGPVGENSVQVAEIMVQTRRIANGMVVSIRDTGPGIPADNLGKVLEPLFTTKSFGPGLGLPIAARILEQHGGTLAIASGEHQGTTVALTLPQQTVLAAVA
jgi:signal transduction histidine kinase